MSNAAGLVDAVESMEARLARSQAHLDGLDAGIEARRRTERELDIEIAFRKGALELSGKRARRRVSQRHAHRRLFHAQGWREANHPFGPWLPLPVTRMNPPL